MLKKSRDFVLSASKIRQFQRLVLAHHAQHRRDFPWRRTRDPYKILVSEVMLQQTQAERVVPKYLHFVQAFPTIESLAQASLRRVLKLWSGLGYNRRAVALQRAAQAMVKQHDGRVPESIEQLTQLSGVGYYTAAAVLVFAFNQPVAMIETNIRTVFIHHFFPRRQQVDDAALEPLIVKTLDQQHPRRWYEVLMDYGAWLKKQGPNPSRRSRHYVRQSQFAGSNRQIRGRLIRRLLGRSAGLSDDQLRLAGVSASKVRLLLQQLHRDGLLTRKRNQYTISA